MLSDSCHAAPSRLLQATANIINILDCRDVVQAPRLLSPTAAVPCSSVTNTAPLTMASIWYANILKDSTVSAAQQI